MNLYLISQNDNCNYDTYDSAVVVAPNEDVARNMHPGDGLPLSDWKGYYLCWCKEPRHVSVKFLGKAHEDLKQGVICASFNAG